MGNGGERSAAAGDPLTALRAQLQRLYRRGGEPSTREIARRTDKAISHTTVSHVLRCVKNPRWGNLELVVESLGGDLEHFRSLWIAVRDAEDWVELGATSDAPTRPQPRTKHLGGTESDLPTNLQEQHSARPTGQATGADERRDAASVALSHASTAPYSRYLRTIAVINIAGWDALKEEHSQDTWLGSLGQLYDTVTNAIAREAVSDVAMKYLNDGVMLSFDVAGTTDALNVVIRIQEIIDQLGRNNRTPPLSCSVGVSTGEVAGFVGPGGNLELLGDVVDKSLRLSGAAHPKAIFADTATLAITEVNRLQSRVGVAVRRGSAEYVGDVQRIPLKGFNEPIMYHEILWDQLLFGVKSAVVTQVAWRSARG